MTELDSAPPTAFTAGSTVKYRASLASYGYPANDGWSLLFILAGPALPVASPLIGGQAGTADGDTFVVTLAAADTADLTSGVYAWVERVSKSGESYDARNGTIYVRPDPASTAAAEGSMESPDAIELASIRAAIAKRLTKDAARLSAFDRAIEREALADLYEREAVLIARVNALTRGGERKSTRIAFVGP